jgi:hypothetical protein
MSMFLRKIGVILTALLLIAATGGYSIYRHYCECQDMMTTSVFLEVECEHDKVAADVPSCCSVESHEMSCSAAEKEGNETHACHTGDCCHTNIEFLKIDDSYTPAQVKVSFEVLALAAPLFENEVLLKENEPLSAGTFISDPSPPLSGRQKLLEIHQLKLAPAELG